VGACASGRERVKERIKRQRAVGNSALQQPDVFNPFISGIINHTARSLSPGKSPIYIYIVYDERVSLNARTAAATPAGLPDGFCCLPRRLEVNSLPDEFPKRFDGRRRRHSPPSRVTPPHLTTHLCLNIIGFAGPLHVAPRLYIII